MGNFLFYVGYTVTAGRFLPRVYLPFLGDDCVQMSQPMSVNDILSLLEEDDECDVETIMINLPLEDTNMPTDEDSDASDLEISGNPLHLPWRILQAEGSMIQSNIEKSTCKGGFSSECFHYTKVEEEERCSKYRRTTIKKDFSLEIVSNSIRRNRFEEILRYLHLANNTRYDGQDRLYKVRPLFSVLNKNFKIPF
ncbi:hypothetical protein J437_LFUL007677 [Ladona fulva]|uniref:PiggyBac transposable element-derived protein domain-containing protein n=1 Tax=Ladona fulva TaxID=123851 RepID=A0A8K0KAD6_LADFU|nr:hypothetical protein J437_LFUL007677 [Ladona fulva]